MDVFAPGTRILITLPGGTYAEQSGRSMAAPFVSGLAPLAVSVYPDATVAHLMVFDKLMQLPPRRRSRCHEGEAHPLPWPHLLVKDHKARLLGATDPVRRDVFRSDALAGGPVLAPRVLFSDPAGPSVPADFRVESANETGARVARTAVGDDGDQGTATDF